MKATTHTEVYRRFEGELGRPRAPLVLARSSLRQGFKRTLPALFLFGPVAISTIVHAFRVYFGYAMAQEQFGDGPRMSGAMLQQVLGDAVDNVLEFLMASSAFGLLVMAWYGAGLIAEDKRLGANLLYFSRPMTRTGYALGKFLAAFAFGALATVVPCIVICSIASFASPEWSFLREEWDTILAALGFCTLWSATLSVLILALSSLTSRKTHALVLTVGVVMVSGLVSEVMQELTRDPRYSLFGLFSNFQRLGEWMLLGKTDPLLGIQPSLLVVAALWVASVCVISSRVKRMEVVA